VIPLVDNGSLEKLDQEIKLIDYLLSLKKFFAERNLKILFESDFQPYDLMRFIDKLPKDYFGINYDMGNSAALGFDPVEEFSAFGSRIVNVHVKDRALCGTTVSLGAGDADFETVFFELKKINYQGNYILQTARAVDQDHAGLISRYRDMVRAWLA
jgi:hexulose-6-phosphate isomerase